jgi:toxin ParE1/3/4
MTLLWSPTARRDLRDMRRYIAQHNPAAADSTVRRILRAVENLEIFPELGRPGRRAGSRELIIPRTPFIVVYATENQTVEVLAVIHGARRWPQAAAATAWSTTAAPSPPARSSGSES